MKPLGAFLGIKYTMKCCLTFVSVLLGISYPASGQHSNHVSSVSALPTIEETHLLSLRSNPFGQLYGVFLESFYVSSDNRYIAYLRDSREIKYSGGDITIIEELTKPRYEIVISDDKVERTQEVDIPLAYDVRDSKIFGPDGRRYAIVASNTPREWSAFIYDPSTGKAQKGENCEAVSFPVFSPDSKRVAYRGTQGGKTFIVIDGVKGNSYDRIIESMAFSPDSKHFAYGALLDKKWFVVVDGVAGKEHDGINDITFSPDSKRIAYIAWRSRRAFVVVDGVEQGKEHDGFVVPPTFSPDSKRLAYGAKLSGSSFVVVDGVAGTKYDGANYITFSPDSKRIAYMAWHSGRAFVVVDGVEKKKYDGLAGGLTFSPDSKRLAYAAVLNGRSFVVVDDVEGKRFQNIVQPGPVFSPDSKRVAYEAVRHDDKSIIVVNDVEIGKPFDGLLRGSTIFFDTPTSYRTIIRRGSGIICQEVKFP